MIARKCLNCGEVNYSADTFSKYWICCRCGCQILKQEKPELDVKLEHVLHIEKRD